MNKLCGLSIWRIFFFLTKMPSIRSLFSFSVCLLLLSCERGKETFKVAATAVPHAEMLELIKPDLKEKGIDLEVIVVDDYNIPNRALAQGEVDANFFQHIPFLEEQIVDFGYPIESLVKVENEPMGIYSRKVTSLNAIPEGGIIAIPNDPTNEARALLLLQREKLIQLSANKGLKATVLDIVDNPKKLKFLEIDAPMLARSLDEVDAAVINANFALQAKLSPESALALEDKNAPFVNIIAIRVGESHKKEMEALKLAMTSEKMREFILKNYHGAVLPAF